MRMIGTYRIGGTWQVPLLLGLALAMTPVSAQDIKVVGLFKDQAILLINGKQRILKVGGEVTLEGVTLVSPIARKPCWKSTAYNAVISSEPTSVFPRAPAHRAHMAQCGRTLFP